MKYCKITVILLAVIILLPFQAVLAADKEGISISDREIIERLTRLEEGQKNLQNQINDFRHYVDSRINGIQNQVIGIQGQINGLQSQINGLRNLIMAGFGVLIAGMFSLVGFVIWDRRSAISPVINRTRDMEDKQILLLKAIREYALKEPKLSEVLKSLGLL